jgi:hypothetical protein
MYDPTCNFHSLRRLVRDSDFPASTPAASRDALISVAASIAHTGFATTSVRAATIRRKTTYSVTNPLERLVLRQANEAIIRLKQIEHSNRDLIVRQLRSILSEGIEYRIYKLDIQSFFESVSIGLMLDLMATDPDIPHTVHRTLTSFFNCTRAMSIGGLLRGIPLSSTLSEYILIAFDRTVAQMPEVYFYARYVDDIIVLTIGDEKPAAFINRLRRTLFPGLKFNTAKSKYYDLKDTPGKDPNILHYAFDFLGYQFNIYKRHKDNNRVARQVRLDISPRKTNRLKSRMLLSFRRFIEDNDFQMLFERLRLIAGNYNVDDKRRSIRRTTGIYCNYRRIDPLNSVALVELDDFIKAHVLYPRGKLSDQIQASITNSQRRQLLSVSFKRSFERRTFYHFTPSRLHDLIAAWSNA